MANESRQAQQPSRPGPTPSSTAAGAASPTPAAPASAPTQVNPPRSPSYIEQAEAFLHEHHWELLGKNEDGTGVWADPLGSSARAATFTEIQLPQKGGGFETVKQIVGPPVHWSYSTQEACTMQRQRNEKGQSERDGSPMQRLTRLERRYDEVRMAHERLVATCELILRSPLPDRTDERMKLVAQIKGRLMEALRAEPVATQAA